MKTIIEILKNQINDISDIVNDVQNTKVTITIKNVQNVYRFNERINDILNNSKLILHNYQITNDYEDVINYIAYIHNFVLSNYKYNENTITYKTINSILDILEENYYNIINLIVKETN